MALNDADGTLSMDAVRKLLEELGDMANELHDLPLNVEGVNNKDRMRINALRSRDLLYAAHLADMLRLEFLNQYHRFKGGHPPTVVP